MNKAEAKEILDAELSKLRARPYSELVSFIDEVQTLEVTGASGSRYQLEFEAMWDDPSKPNDVLRVFGSIDDGRVRALFPLSDSFLIAPGKDLNAVTRRKRAPKRIIP